MIKITGLAWDVTREKTIELQLRESQVLYQAIIGNSMSAFFLSNDKGGVLDTYDAACTLFGYTREELKKTSRQHILDDEDPEFLNALRHRKKTGHIKYLCPAFK